MPATSRRESHTAFLHDQQRNGSIKTQQSRGGAAYKSGRRETGSDYWLGEWPVAFLKNENQIAFRLSSSRADVTNLKARFAACHRLRVPGSPFVTGWLSALCLCDWAVWKLARTRFRADDSPKVGCALSKVVMLLISVPFPPWLPRNRSCATHLN